MKRKQVVFNQHQNLDGDDNSNDGAYTEEELLHHNKKAKTFVKHERDEHFSSSDSDDSDTTSSWSSASGRPHKDLPLRAMKQGVMDCLESDIPQVSLEIVVTSIFVDEKIREAYTVGAQGWTAKADIFEDYLSQWARMGREPQLTAPAFGRLVHKAFPGIKSCRMGPRVRARHCYKGLMRRGDDASSLTSSSSSSSPVTTINSPVSEVATSSSSPAASSPLIEQQHYHQHYEQSDLRMEQEYLDLESALESVEMLSAGTVNVKREPLANDNDEIVYQTAQLQQFKVEEASNAVCETVSYANDMSSYHHNYQQPQQFCYPAAGQQQLYYASSSSATTPDLDVGSTSSSTSSSPTATPSPYEWSTFPTTAATASLPAFTSFPAYTSSVSVPLPPCYYPVPSAADAYGYPSGGAAWAYPTTTTGFGGFDAYSMPTPPVAYTTATDQQSLSSSARSDILLSSFLSFDL